MAVKRAFPDTVLGAIERAIGEAERSHAGEIRFALEGALDLGALLRDQSPRARAVAAFSNLGVWDTEHNNGVLIYVLLADRDVEIIADRGVMARVGAGELEALCRVMESAFREGRFEGGTVQGIRALGEVLARHFPRQAGERDELSDRPVIL
ncbi:MAG TPA: TPM domain-containing protein [Burkholderiales bacterium]